MKVGDTLLIFETSGIKYTDKNKVVTYQKRLHIHEKSKIASIRKVPYSEYKYLKLYEGINSLYEIKLENDDKYEIVDLNDQLTLHSPFHYTENGEEKLIWLSAFNGTEEELSKYIETRNAEDAIYKKIGYIDSYYNLICKDKNLETYKSFEALLDGLLEKIGPEEINKLNW